MSRLMGVPGLRDNPPGFPRLLHTAFKANTAWAVSSPPNAPAPDLDHRLQSQSRVSSASVAQEQRLRELVPVSSSLLDVLPDAVERNGVVERREVSDGGGRAADIRDLRVLDGACGSDIER